MTVYKNILETIGNTPMVELKKIKEMNGLYGNIYAKIESFNPAGSVKDRTAYSLIASLENNERFRKARDNGEKISIVEATSGNTGVALAMICAYLGYELIICMPSNMSKERVSLLKAYGAVVILTDASAGMAGAIEKSGEFKESYTVSQFSNPYNPKIHEETTGKEIYDDLNGKVDIFVAGVGTGGTITGVARYLKKHGNTKVIAVEPFDSQVLRGGQPHSHALAGIGANFIPEVLDLKLLDGITDVKTEEAFFYANVLAKNEGILCGISGGAALFGAVKEAKKECNKGKNIVVIIPDTGERYLSTSLFDEK
ncbi:MAG: cysteine synthase A [Clostridia bacterium]|jgi:cysteine synthase A